MSTVFFTPVAGFMTSAQYLCFFTQCHLFDLGAIASCLGPRWASCRGWFEDHVLLNAIVGGCRWRRRRVRR